MDKNSTYITYTHTITHNLNSFINADQKYGKQLSLVTVKRINRKKSINARHIRSENKFKDPRINDI